MKKVETVLTEKITQEPDYLLRAARELLAWDATGVLKDGVVRHLAMELEHELRLPYSRALLIAEDALKDEIVKRFVRDGVPQ